MLLNGWKEIARHLQRGVRTVQRWEHLGMPVIRVNRTLRSPVIAHSEEVDRWLTRFQQTGSPKPYLIALLAEARRKELHRRIEALRQRRAKLIRITEYLQTRNRKAG